LSEKIYFQNMINVDAPKNRKEIVREMERLHSESTAYWNSFSIEEFFRPFGQAWSPADNVRHLNKSNRAVAQALRLPGLMLGLAFGRAPHPSRNYDELKQTYLAILASGGQAGRFAPTSRLENDLKAWREKIMAEREKITHELVSLINRWSETALERYRLPHPLLGKLTLREMLFFTLYHNLHHVEVVERRREENHKDTKDTKKR
jgi:hypothetical protein